ncbi:autotransporter family protein [Achromobacter marplatensis]|uniref:autotransporter family protein n=1 Tax=Achromobacter marplatensis TaxID=470868 RepID=UPI0039F69F49
MLLRPNDRRPPSRLKQATAVALSLNLYLFIPADTLAAAGHGGGGMGGMGAYAGGQGGGGGGLKGGNGGQGGDVIPESVAIGGYGGAGGGFWNAPPGGTGVPAGSPGNAGGGPSGTGGTAGSAGTPSRDASGAILLLGAGGGSGGVAGAGGGGGGSSGTAQWGFAERGGYGGNQNIDLTGVPSYRIDGPSTVVGKDGMNAASGGAGGGGTSIIGLSRVDLFIDAPVIMRGGAGSDSVNAIPFAGGLSRGGGGGGGAAIAIDSGALILNGNISGGAGGTSYYRSGGGGDAVVLTSGDITVGPQAVITGGAGGRIYSGGLIMYDTRSGDGGTGVSIGSGSVVNNGSIAGGAAGSAPFWSEQGADGAALRAGTMTTVVNKGALAGTTAAVIFEGDRNKLVLWQGSATTGDVRFKGTGNQLALGSDSGAPVRVAMAGGLDLGSGGIYVVRATATQADRLDVGGAAKISGATVQVAATPGAFAENSQHVVLHADGAFSGTRFVSATSNLAYLVPSLSYSADDRDAILTLTRKQIDPEPEPLPQPQPGTQPGAGSVDPATRPIRFADLVSTPNARATANAVDSMPIGNEVYRSALNLPVGAPPAFFSALSGEVHASTVSALRGIDSQTRNVPFAHLRASLGAGMRPGAPTAGAGLSDVAPAASTLPVFASQPAWAQLVGNWQRLGATSNTAAVRQHTGGVFVGADHAIGSGWRLGGALGYTDSDLRLDGVDAQTDVSSYSAVMYGGQSFQAGSGKLNLLLGGAYSWHDIGSERRIAMGGLDQTLTADYGASTTQLFSELGYAWQASAAFTLEPYAGVAWAGRRTRSFSESGGSAALSGASQAANTTTATLGVRGRQEMLLGTVRASVTAGLGWRHAFGDVLPATRMAFDAGDSFSVAGAPIARDAALLDVGLNAAVGRNATLGLAYSGQFGGGNRDHGAALSWRWAF